MGEPFLEVINLSKSFGGLDAVSDVSFEIGRDEIVGLIGPNGAGKTTIIRLITSMLKPTSGEVRFMGEDITGKPTFEIGEDEMEIGMGMSTGALVLPFKS